MATAELGQTLGQLNYAGHSIRFSPPVYRDKLEVSSPDDVIEFPYAESSDGGGDGDDKVVDRSVVCPELAKRGRNYAKLLARKSFRETYPNPDFLRTELIRRMCYWAENIGSLDEYHSGLECHFVYGLRPVAFSPTTWDKGIFRDLADPSLVAHVYTDLCFREQEYLEGRAEHPQLTLDQVAMNLLSIGYYQYSMSNYEQTH